MAAKPPIFASPLENMICFRLTVLTFENLLKSLKLYAQVTAYNVGLIMKHFLLAYKKNYCPMFPLEPLPTTLFCPPFTFIIWCMNEKLGLGKTVN